MRTRLEPTAFRAPATLERIGEKRHTVVFIPAWNEEANLPAVLDELRHELPGADLLVIDDGSTDQTAAMARAREPT